MKQRDRQTDRQHPSNERPSQSVVDQGLGSTLTLTLTLPYVPTGAGKWDPPAETRARPAAPRTKRAAGAGPCAVPTRRCLSPLAPPRRCDTYGAVRHRHTYMRTVRNASLAVFSHYYSFELPQKCVTKVRPQCRVKVVAEVHNKARGPTLGPRGGLPCCEVLAW